VTRDELSDIPIPRGYALRTMRHEQPGELALVVSRSLRTVLETIPEFGGDEARAREVMRNFSHEEMRAMYLRDQERPATHRFVVAHTQPGEVVGQSVYFLREPELGYLFTLYVEPTHRRLGLAKALLAEAVSWLEQHGAARVIAHTHATNVSLQALAASLDFRIIERTNEPSPHLTLERASSLRSAERNSELA
jgi:ribosomal protein S18 acetylase RimI-like enzyme